MNKSCCRNLHKLEFVVTEACSGSCKHCSVGGHKPKREVLDGEIGARAVRDAAELFALQTVMVFGGEPLLAPAPTLSIIRVARDLGIRRRQIITNGFFTRDAIKIEEMAVALGDAGVNDLLLSVDAFHQETIDLAFPLAFAKALRRVGVPCRLSPAWLVSRTDDNPYNKRTREILSAFSELDVQMGDGNIIFPEGNAKIYLAEYFKGDTPENPYVDDPYDLTCLSVSANGDLLDGNLYRSSLAEIVDGYDPTKGGKP